MQNPFYPKMKFYLIITRKIEGIRREQYRVRITAKQTNVAYAKDKEAIIDWDKGLTWTDTKNKGFLIFDLDDGQLALSSPKNKIQIDASYETKVAIGSGILKQFFSALIRPDNKLLSIMLALVCILMGFAFGTLFGNIAPIGAIQEWLSHIHL
jgi:hypothetical protein